MPHYLRVARALALLSGVLATGSSATGCYRTHVRTGDAGSVDASGPDATLDAGRCPVPLPCECPTLGTSGTCGGTSFEACCPIVGPLSPPELALA